MHDIRFIRENPAAFDAGLARRGHVPRANLLLGYDSQVRAVKTEAEKLLAERNGLSKSIGKLMSEGKAEEAAEAKAKAEVLKNSLPVLEVAMAEWQTKLDDELNSIPNLPVEEVPQGADENDNAEVSRWGEPRAIEGAKEHFDIGAPLGLDFESAQVVSGARFAYLRGPIARLNRAIGQFMLDTHTEIFGYQEVVPPVLVRDDALFGTAQLPKFAEDLFATTDGRWLIPTAEVSLTNLVREQILDGDLPLRFTALTLCFRSEAGAAGKDTRGLIRQHQFDKCELVSITTPEQSNDEHERMTGAAEHILQSLGLPYRRMLLCSGDMGFSARKTYDLEVWLPGQGKYREISSCSNCGDFQARRMNARYRPAGEKGTKFVHTLNGSGLAVGRTLVAILENYQNEDGSVTIPEALRPYMGGLDRISAL
ncbi:MULTISPECIES: serine--tRNA ligase [unclassified Novosphingobium]|uniref:serine--tRNA ligase n=1 Tax=unclassified Novosphingobium TaxID=2644732 RepID=UPI00086E611F|nr:MULTISPECIES: serine--tRNA ligase [unclassified Novosphingobium]MBN9146028.1 serine--tRNA ligase [Novosphingobium sp.]ODU79380.1 MAG: serine--tRNA ligase [Novosphingobium sp. SCN 63-17]OJX94125.1 MAG: serine--tRNA ligase [Novosphingobium sp. 63-713]